MEFFTISREARYFQGIKTTLEYKEYKFYIFFIAFYTLCYTFFLTLNYWYNKPEIKFKNKRKRYFISYERNSFILTAVYWLFKLTILSLMFAYSSILSCMDLYENYNYLFYLLAIVLFFDLWKGFRRVFKVTFFHLALSFIVIILLSLFLTFFRPYDDNGMINFINRGFTNKNFELPFLETAEVKMKRCENTIFITKDDSIFLDDVPRPLSNIRHFVKHSDKYSWHSTCLYVDKNASVKIYNEVKLELRKADKLRLNLIINKLNDYCIIPNRQAIYIGLPPYSFSQIIVKAPNSKTFTLQEPKQIVDLIKNSGPPPPPPFMAEINEKNLIKIERTKTNILFNDSIVQLENLEELLIKRNNKDKLILYNGDENINFQKYIEVLNEIKNSIYYQRDNLSFKETGYDYKELKLQVSFEKHRTIKTNYKSIHKEIRTEHPFRIVENYKIIHN